jgi:excinuclease ABC subunit A
MYLLDEPTIGLHYADVKKLIEILDRLVVKGNTVMVIEHNMDLIKSADYIIDIGPEGGSGGGKVVAQGTPEEVAKTAGSYTGEYLKKVLRRN